MTLREYLNQRIEELGDLEREAVTMKKGVTQVAYAFGIKELEELRYRLHTFKEEL